MRIADEHIRFFFIRREGGSKFFDSRREQTVKRFILVVEHEWNVVLQAILVGGKTFAAYDR